MNRKVAWGITLPAKDRQWLASLERNGGTWFSRAITMGLISIFMVLLMASVAVAQVQLGKRKRPSTRDRVFGERPVPIGEHVFTIGGPNLKYLAPGASKWKTLATNPGEILQRLALNDAGTQVLAYWKGANDLHLFTLEGQKHTQLPRPPFVSIKTLAFAANGRDALVYTDNARTFRVALDGQSEPEVIIPIRFGQVLKVAPQGMLFSQADETDSMCRRRGAQYCTYDIVFFKITDKGFKKKTVFSVTPPIRLGAAAVPGGDPGQALLTVGTRQANGRPGEAFYLHYDLAEGKTIGSIPVPTERANGSQDALFYNGRFRFKRWLVSQPRNEVLDLYRKGTDLEIRIVPLTPGEKERRVILRSRGNSMPSVHGFGAQSDGSVWIHWGDDLIILDANDAVRGLDLNFLREPFGKEKTGWATATLSGYESKHIWVGIELGPGRYYARVDFSDFDTRAKPWPTVAPEEYGLHCCDDLPDEKTLMTWRPNLTFPICAAHNFRNKEVPAIFSYELLKTLPDGTLIIQTIDGKCSRVIPKDCEEIRRKRTPSRNRNRNRNR